jgi:integrase
MGVTITKRERQGKTVWTTLVQLPPDPETGKRRQTRISRPTKHEVEVEVAKLTAGKADGTYSEAAASKITVAEYLDKWLKHISATIRPASHGRYSEVVRLHIKPELGKVQLAKLTPLQVQRFYGKLLDDGLSKSTVNNIHAMFHRALSQAMKWGLLTRNVTEMTEPPTRTKREYIVWTGDQVRSFLAVAERDEYAALWRLAVYTGMRRGELLGLKWEDIDLNKAVLSVKRTYSRGTDNKFEAGQTKTASGRRQITLPSNVVESLRTHRVQQLEARVHLKGDYHDQGYVFADAIGDVTHPNTLTHHFHNLIADAKLPRIRIHDLRHGHATLLMEDGVHPKVVSERLGHSNTRVTLDLYSHVTPTMQRQVSNRLESLIEGSA